MGLTPRSETEPAVKPLVKHTSLTPANFNPATPSDPLLAGRRSVSKSESEEMIAEDWVWYVPVRTEEFRLAPCCGHQNRDDDDSGLHRSRRFEFASSK